MPRFCGHGLVGLRPAGQAQGELADLKRRRPCLETASQTATWAKTPHVIRTSGPGSLPAASPPALGRPLATSAHRWHRAPHTHPPPTLRPRQGLAGSLKLSKELAFFHVYKLLPLEMGNGLANAFQHQDVIFLLFRVYDGQGHIYGNKFQGTNAASRSQHLVCYYFIWTTAFLLFTGTGLGFSFYIHAAL